MAKKHLCFMIVAFYLVDIGLRCWATTDGIEVQALQDLYRALNTPAKLEHWKSEGGDPCGETWFGVECSGSSVTHMNLHGLGLTGNLGVQLSNLNSLKKLDISANNIKGSIPDSLPPNLTNLNLAENKFSESFPYSLDKMKNLRHLNLSHNFLAGPLGDAFNGLQDLKQMDLSFNDFTGDLPSSFRSLKNLTQLFLQNNQFTGSVTFLANLSLSYLNIEDNHFSGVIPENFQTIEHLWIGGNKFHMGPNYPPWRFPSDLMPTEKNISSPPATNLSALVNHQFQKIEDHKNKKVNIAMKIVLFLIGGSTLVGSFGALAVILHRQRVRTNMWRSMRAGEEESMRSRPTGRQGVGYRSMSMRSGPHVSGFGSVMNMSSNAASSSGDGPKSSPASTSKLLNTEVIDARESSGGARAEPPTIGRSPCHFSWSIDSIESDIFFPLSGASYRLPIDLSRSFTLGHSLPSRGGWLAVNWGEETNIVISDGIMSLRLPDRLPTPGHLFVSFTGNPYVYDIGWRERDGASCACDVLALFVHHDRLTTSLYDSGWQIWRDNEIFLGLGLHVHESLAFVTTSTHMSYGLIGLEGSYVISWIFGSIRVIALIYAYLMWEHHSRRRRWLPPS